MKAQAKGLNLDITPCCVLPYGTGNDFARQAGWGGGPNQSFFKTLKTLMYEICLDSTEEFFNVWDVQVKYRDRGDTQVVDSRTRQYISTEETGFQRYMLNYIGIGEDARIAMGFEVKRTSNRCANECVYIWEGLKKMCCNPTRRIKSQIDYMATEKEVQDHNQSESLKGAVLFSTQKGKGNKYVLAGNPISIVGTNIRSFMGGRRDLWASSNNKVGLKNDKGKNLQKQEKPQFSKTSCSDDMMEFFSFQKTVDLGLGICSRVAQDKGPFIFKFKTQEDMHVKDYVTYLQIDGEVYRLKNPDRIKLQLAQEISNGKLRVLTRNKGVKGK